MQPESQPQLDASPPSIDRLAEALFDVAGHQEVRVIEAVAAVFTRRWQEGFADLPSGLCEPGAERPFTKPARDEDGAARLAICQRIARRALRGSLIDPTRGATAMHRIDDSPPWARDLLPIGMFGPFLFYRLTPERLRTSDGHGVHGHRQASGPQRPLGGEMPDRGWWHAACAPDRPGSTTS